MCRLLAYQGNPNFISDHVFDPTHSLIEQSHHATKGKMSVNADGYGLAWQSERDEAAIFKDILPAWGCENLLHVANHVKSSTFIAHVRASTAAPVSRLNCHPFKYDGWAFAHNGQINEYQKIKREVEGNLSIDLYHAIQGQTDSEIVFLGLMDREFNQDPVRATKSYIQYLEQVAKKNNIKIPLVLTAAMFKADQLIMIRYASKGRKAPSLFRKGCVKGVCFASEPYENDGTWSEVQQNSITTCIKGQEPKVDTLEIN